MGIPSYFSHIIRTYSNIVRNLRFFKTQSTFRFNHLFMDCNSIVYDAVHTVESQVNSGTISDDSDLDTIIINYVIHKIDEYISIIQPSTTIYIAFDGVAPFAKMEQQRTRRYKSNFMSNIHFGTGVHKIKKKAEQLACLDALKKIEKYI